MAERWIAVVLAALSLGGYAMNDASALNASKRAKKDEFYTQRVDIENELKHYRAHFAGKVVLCNCDDPRQSEFFKYFSENFEKLKLKRLIATCYKSQDADLFSRKDCERAIKQVYEGDKNGNMVVDDDEVGEQFEILGCSDNGAVAEEYKLPHFKRHNEPYIDGKKVYKRIFIRHRRKAQ